MSVDVILGLQWGDEGKGKIVDFLAPRYDIVARFQGGPNAGHTLKFNNQKFVLHTVPSGIFRENQLNVIGNGVVIDPITLAREINGLNALNVSVEGRLLVARKAHLILPTHRYLDAASENAKGVAKIGSTLKGIGPTYMDKTGRNGLRVGDLSSPDFLEKYNVLKQKHLKLLSIYPQIEFDLAGEEEKWLRDVRLLQSLPLVDCEYFLNDALRGGKRILAEGAQGSMLDIDYGTYPYVTSSNTITAGVCIGLGVAPSAISEVIGITKAYCTRVGSGPFPTELNGEVGEFLRKEGAEFGATTGRPRRCGWLDLPQLRYTCMVNGVTQLVVTKIDVLDKMEQISIADSYLVDGEKTLMLPYDITGSDLQPSYQPYPGWRQSLDGVTEFDQFPDELRSYLQVIEEGLNVPITMVSTGPERRKLVTRQKAFTT